MTEQISVTFIREMNSWEGVYLVGATYLCRKDIAARLCGEGFVKLTSQVTLPAPRSDSTVTRRKPRKPAKAIWPA